MKNGILTEVEVPKGETRNSKVLKDFVDFCEKAPDLRFWQALACWSGYDINARDEKICNLWGSLYYQEKDTFYWEGKNK